MNNVVIQVHCLSKQYRLGTIGGRRLVDDVSRWLAKLGRKEDPLSKVGLPLTPALSPSDGERENKANTFVVVYKPDLLNLAEPAGTRNRPKKYEHQRAISGQFERKKR